MSSPRIGLLLFSTTCGAATLCPAGEEAVFSCGVEVDRSELNFTIAGTEYSVHDDFDGEGKPSSARGVRVTTNGKAVDLPCMGPVVSNLPQLESLVPCDVDHALGNCR